MTWTTLAAGCAVALALVLVTSGIGKLRDVTAFARSLPDSVPAVAARPGLLRRTRPIAVAVCVAELGIAVVLVAAVVTGWAWLGVLGLLGAAGASAVFTGVVRSMLRREVRRPCHCFGADATPPSRADLARNAVLLTIAVLGTAAAALGAGSGPVPATLLWVAAGAGAAAGLVLIELDGLAWLLEPVRPYGAG